MTNLRGTYMPPRPTEPALAGQSVMLVVVDEGLGRSRYVRGYRAASEIYLDRTGHRVIRVVNEPDWYAWLSAGADKPEVCARSEIWPADLVWAD